MVEGITMIVQARMGALRLPGKVLRTIAGATVLEHIVSRMRMMESLERIVVATSTEEQDAAIARECERLGVDCFRGSEGDVLARFYFAAKQFRAAHVMRFCADNPLLDPHVLDRLSALYRQGFRYVQMHRFPIGLGGEVFPFALLEEAFEKGLEPLQREHVTPYMKQTVPKAEKGTLVSKRDYSMYRFTVDTELDWEFVNRIYAALYTGNHDFFLDDVIRFLEENPDVYEINKDVVQR